MSRLPKKQVAARLAAYNPAAPNGQSYPGQRPMSDPWVDQFVRMSQDFWRQRGVAVPDRISVDVADDLRINDGDATGPAGRGGINGEARIALDGKWLGTQLGRARSSRRSTKTRRQALSAVAALVAHEVGHAALGQADADHTDTGLMAAQAKETPYEMLREVRRLVPRRPGERAAPAKVPKVKRRGGVTYGVG